MNLHASAAGVAAARGLGMAAAFAFTVVVAHFFGGDRATDIAFAALIIPQALMVNLGTLFPPVFVSMFKSVETTRGTGEAWAFGRSALRVVALAAAAAAAAGVLLSPLLARAVAGNFNPEEVAQTSRYMQFAFFLVLFTAASSTLKGLLNAGGAFFVPSLDTLAVNATAVAVVVAMRGRWDVFSLVAGVVAGGLFKVLVMTPTYFRLRRPGRGPLIHPALKDSWSLLYPVLLNAVVFMLMLSVMRALAARTGVEGAVSHLTYADKIVSAPQDIFVISIATVLLPSLAGDAAAGCLDEVRRRVTLGLRMSAFFGIPVAVGMFVLAEPVVALIFQHGLFDASDTLETARVLRAYAGTLAFSGLLILYQAFYALRATGAILASGAAMLAVTAALGAAFLGPFRQAGPALACSISFVAGYLVLLILFVRRAGWPDLRGLAKGVAGTLVAAAVMGAAAWALGPRVHVLLRAAAGMAVFALLARFLCPEEWRQARKLWGRNPC